MPTAAVERGSRRMDKKILSISSKRQITIPQKFYQMLDFGDEAECVVRGDALVIRPVKVSAGGEFAEQILTELVREGLLSDQGIWFHQNQICVTEHFPGARNVLKKAGLRVR